MTNYRPFVRSSIKMTRDNTDVHSNAPFTPRRRLQQQQQPPILNRSLTAVSFRPKSNKRERTEISLKSSTAEAPYTSSCFKVNNLNLTYEIQTIYPIKVSTSTTAVKSRTALKKSVPIEPIKISPNDVVNQKLIEQQQHIDQMRLMAKEKYAKREISQQCINSKSFISNLRERTTGKKQTTFMTDFNDNYQQALNRSAFDRSQAYVTASARTVDPHKRSMLKKREAIHRKYSNLTEIFKNDSLDSYSSDSLRLTPLNKRLMSTQSNKFSDDSKYFSLKSKTGGFKSTSYVNPQNSFFESASRLSDASSYDSDLPKPDLWAVEFDD